MLAHENVKTRMNENASRNRSGDDDARKLNKYHIKANNILSKVLSQ